jgi:hypothetical protein
MVSPLPCHVEAPCRPDIDPPICAPHVKSCAQRLACGASRCAVYSPYSIHRARDVTFAFTRCPRQSSSCCPTCRVSAGQGQHVVVIAPFDPGQGGAPPPWPGISLCAEPALPWLRQQKAPQDHGKVHKASHGSGCRHATPEAAVEAIVASAGIARARAVAVTCSQVAPTMAGSTARCFA